MGRENMFGWGLIGASTIAAEHMISAIRAQTGHDVVAVASSSAERRPLLVPGWTLPKRVLAGGWAGAP